jgi:hypothetical protein
LTPELPGFHANLNEGEKTMKFIKTIETTDGLYIELAGLIKFLTAFNRAYPTNVLKAIIGLLVDGSLDGRVDGWKKDKW